MSTREQLNRYLQELEKRLRWMALSKGAAILLGVALGSTVGLVLITNAFAFSSNSLTVARVVLFLALATAVGFALVIPLLRLNRRKAAGRAETSFPEFKERLVTYVERSEARDPMLDLLAMDTMQVAQRTEPERVAPPKWIWASATGAGAAGAILIWLIAAGPGFLGYGASLLWAGTPKSGVNFYDIRVEPGNKLVRRRSDQVVTAQLSGFESPNVRLMAKYQSAAKWEEAQMVPRAGSAQYEFLFAGLPEPVEYYVEAGGVRSKTFKLDVVDLPGIKHVKVTYHYPSWLGLKDGVEDPGGDVRAVKGTVAELTVETDRPLRNGTVEVDDGSHIKLEPTSDGKLTAKIAVEKDGVFHFAATEQGESVRLSEDYFIEARNDDAPSVKIVRPRSDARVSPIEEVMVAVEAADDYGLSSVELHYSVNGGEEKVVPIAKGGKNASGQTLIALEDYKLVPGDVIAMYATAKDARTTSRTEISFIQAEPFERNFSQSQQMGGGGGGGGGMNDQEEISQRQKEIIAATWNEIRGNAKDRAAENARFLSEVQTKLKEQAQSLAQRSRSRQLAGANQEFQEFVKSLEAAAQEMGPASDKLKAQSWKDALGPEQRALQHLLRAEATFRDIQLAFGAQGGGGGGGSAGRDLASMFDLELDTEKNQYETGQQSGGQSEEQRQKQIDEALQRLSELARRQQELARNQNQSKQQAFEQRWQQEMLRREAEELRKQMEQLQRNQQSQMGQQGQQQGQQSNQGGQPGQSGQSGQSGQRGQQSARANQQQMQQAIDRLNQALNDMRAAQERAQRGAQTGQDAAGAQADARRAAERLAEAQRALNALRQQQSGSQLDDLSQRADQLAAQQHDFENRMKQAFGNQDGNQTGQQGQRGGQFGQQGKQGQQQGQGAGLSPAQARALAEEKEKMAAALDQLERDMQKAARDLAGTQPGAAARVRDGLSDIQQNEAKMRMQYSARWIRDGQGRLMVPREAPITQALDSVSRDLKAAQQALGANANQDGQRNANEQTLARLERLRSQMQQLAGQQNGQNGQNGSQQGGNQQGNQQGGQAGGPGGAYTNRARGRFNGGYFGRFQPEGVFDVPDVGYGDPGAIVRDAQLQLNDLREQFKDDPDLAREIDALNKDLARMTTGQTASPELDARISREILPKLEALEVLVRRNGLDAEPGQVRSGATDRAPAGYTDAVAEYFRRLSKGR